MSMKNVTQLIEKVNQRGAPSEFWKKGQNKQCNQETKVFNNCLAKSDIPLTRDATVSEEISFNNNLDHVEKWTEEDLNHIQNDVQSILNPNDDSEDTDETDYFDSEDEYWESVRKTHLKEMFCSVCLQYHPRLSAQEDAQEDVANFHKYEVQEDNDISKWISSEAQKFANDNNFEIKDVYGDGNCLFRAIADQFMVNGCPGHTEVSLRETAIKHLRAKPATYGIHSSSFLSGESWEDYLKRMNKTGEWGDHIILQALADVFLLHITIFNVVNNDIRRTEIITGITKEGSTFQIFLGHVGEFHYYSLRSMTWRIELPYKSLMYRMLVTCSEKSSEERSKMVDRNFAFMLQGCATDSYLADAAQFVMHCIHLQGNSRGELPAEEINFEPIFKSYIESELQHLPKKGSQTRLVEDQLYVDHVSGIPLPHLTFIIRHILPVEMFLTMSRVDWHLFQERDVLFHFLGSFHTDSRIFLRDLSWTQKSHSSMKLKNGSNIPRIVVLRLDKEVIYERGIQTWEPVSGHLYVDCSETHPGYCRLKLPFFDSIDNNDSVLRIDSNLYQKAFLVPDRLYSQITMAFPLQIQCLGLRCFTFPFFNRWENGRQSEFPSRNAISSIIKVGCSLIPKSHPKSKCPEIEWKFDFSMAEHIIFKSLTNAQSHGFFVLKVMLDSMIHHLPFKTKHLKSVFLMACEKITSNFWVNNISGCVLYVLESLLSCLKSRFLPNYFIPENNLLDCFKEDDINTLCIIVEYIRHFPVSVIQIVAEKHGYKFAANLIKRLLSNAKDFVEKNNFNTELGDSWLHLSVATAKVMARKGFYSVSFNILKRGLEQRLLLPDTIKKQDSLTFGHLFESVLLEIKQTSSRFILASIYDETTGPGMNISESIIKQKDFALQTFLPWTVDQRIGWLKIPEESVRHLTTIASFLYAYSKNEFRKQNSVLSELAITIAIRCMKELSSEDSLKEETIDSGSKEVNSQKHMIKKTLISYYEHVYAVASLYHDVHLVTKYVDEIEHICQDFPEISKIASLIFQILGQPDKSRKYAKMFADYKKGRGMDLGYHLF